MKDGINAAIVRWVADESDRLRRRQDLRTAVELWGAEAIPPGGPYPDAFTADARPAAPADTGNANRHRRRRTAAKSRH